MYTPDWDEVKEGLILEGLMDLISLGWVHGRFFGPDSAQAPPPDHVQTMTLRMIRELVTEGLFVLGVPNTTKADPAGFTEWDLPIDEAIAKIKKTYIGNYDDRWSWDSMVWLNHTKKGEELALEIYRQDYPEGPSWPGWKPRFN